MGLTPVYGARAEKPLKNADFAMKQTNICRLSGDINNQYQFLVIFFTVCAFALSHSLTNTVLLLHHVALQSLVTDVAVRQLRGRDAELGADRPTNVYVNVVLTPRRAQEQDTRSKGAFK